MFHIVLNGLSLLFATVYSSLAALWAFEKCLVLVFYLSIVVALGHNMCAIMDFLDLNKYKYRKFITH